MKTRFFILVGLLVVIMAMSMGVMAQDSDTPPCQASEVLDAEFGDVTERVWLQTVIGYLNAYIEDNNMDRFLFTTRALRNGLERIEANCRGLHFTSDEEGMKAVIGPVTFPDGTWKVSLKADGILTVVKLTDLAGTCYDFIPSVLSANNPSLEIPSEAVVKLQGCEALIEVESIGSKSWDLIFVPIKLDQ